MKKIFQIGAGLVGKAMALDLAKNHKVFLADNNKNLLDDIKSINSDINIFKLDVRDKKAVSNFIKEADIVLLAVPGFLGFEALETIINCKKNVVDISFSPENTLELNNLAQKNNVSVVVDAGVAPGIPNFLLGFWNTKMKIESFDYIVGGLPKNPKPPFFYKAPFSPIDVIEEYTRPARMMIDGEVIVRPALSDLEIINVKDVGKLEGFNTDGLRSLLETMPHIKNMKEKTLRFPGHTQLMQNMSDKGLFNKDNINKTSEELFKNWKLGKNEPEFTVLDINIFGDKKIHYHLYDEFCTKTKTSSMARTTGYTATATVNMLLDNMFNDIGVFPPEKVGSNAACTDFLLDYLNIRDIKISQKNL
tara:strand:+ start:233 stop:1318 length:1086 start_codon:yes stop_codon:yes gene_type:complete